jgi:hypothetical protein
MILKYKMKEWFKDRIRTFHGNFYTLWGRPIKAEDIFLESHYTVEEKIGIVIQGGIWHKYDFTLETVKLYKKHYPDVCVILSTWKDTPENYVEPFRKLGIEIILNEKPKPIPGNGNLQIISSYAGIMRAKELGCQYVCKTRTDQRMYATDIFSYFKKLLQIFPLRRKCDANSRIIALGSNTYRNRLYDINDMFCFGEIDDVLKYWSCSPDMVWHTGLPPEERITENYICTEYLRAIGHDILGTQEDTLFCYANYFVVIDLQSIDLYFVKRNKEYFNKFYYENALEEFSFRDWLILQEAE